MAESNVNETVVADEQQSAPLFYEFVVSKLNPAFIANGEQKQRLKTASAAFGLKLVSRKDGTFLLGNDFKAFVTLKNKLTNRDSDTTTESAESGRNNFPERQKYAYFCSQCPFKTGRSKTLVTHRKLHESGRQLLSCTMCPSFATFNKSFFLHHQNKHKNVKQHCSECDYSCYGDRTLKNHILLKHKNPSAVQNSETTKENSTFEVALMAGSDHAAESRHKPSKISCSFCPYSCSKMSRLKRHHDVVHQKTKNFKCRKCPSEFGRSDTLAEHTKNVHTTQSSDSSGLDKKQCSICHKMFSKNWNLIEHMESHKTSKDILCESCGKSFQSKASLRKHQRTFHTNRTEFGCQLCQKTFKTKDGLTRHLKTKIHEPCEEESTGQNQ